MSARFALPLRLATAVMGLFFVFSVAVQYNDPDPVRWMVIYGAAAILSLAAIRAALPPFLPALHAGIALGWALVWLPGAVRTSFAEMFRTYEMMSPAMEEGREMLGLAIVAAWMTVLAVASSRARRTTA